MANPFEFSPMPMSAVFDIKGDRNLAGAMAEALDLVLPPTPNSSGACGQTEIYWVGDRHWLLRAPLHMEAKLLLEIEPSSLPHGILVAQVSDLWSFFRLSGDGCAVALSVASSLDLSYLSQNAATFTEAFGERALLIRRCGHFELAFENSVAAFMTDCFSRIAGFKPESRAAETVLGGAFVGCG